jgi:hypothetical protein
MKSSRKRQDKKQCKESIEDTEMPLYEEANVQVTSNGKYECRYCGLFFETLEAQDMHFRQVHGKAQTYLRAKHQS